MMYLRNLSAALVVAGASAILIPPSFASADLDLGDDNAMEIAIDPFKRTVLLDCATCDVASKEGDGLVWSKNAANSLLLDFAVGKQQDTLDIGGVQLYPPTFGYFTEPFYVTQAGSWDDIRLRVTGYTFRYTSAETISEEGMELLPMIFQVTAIEGRPMEPPALKINLLKDANGRLMIASFQTVQAGEASPHGQAIDCQDWPLLCKWKSALDHQLDSVKSSFKKGCHKHKGNPMTEETTKNKPPHKFRPGHPHHHPHKHHMGGHHHHHGVRRAILRFLYFVVIPVLVGFVAGSLTYLLGMALGTLAASLVAKARGQPTYESVEQDEVDEGSDFSNEKEVYAEPPQYEAPPVYEEPVEKEVVEESK